MRALAIDRPAVVDWYLRNRARSRAIFDLIDPAAYYSRPIALRNPIVFYEGHLPAFSIISFLRRGLGHPPIDARLEKLFERGIDPDSTEAAVPRSGAGTMWPSRDEVLAFAERADDAIVHALEGAEFLEDRPAMQRAQALYTALEHEAMHQETLLYMWHRLPYEQKNKVLPPEGGRSSLVLPPDRLRPDSRTFGRGYGEGRSHKDSETAVRIPVGIATLGADRGRIAFGWDNEFDEHRVEVPAFEIDVYNVTNAQFMEFVEAGGYRTRELWSAENWRWVQEEKLEHPTFWAPSTRASTSARSGQAAEFFWRVHEEKLTSEQIVRVFAFWEKCLEWAKSQPGGLARVCQSGRSERLRALEEETGADGSRVSPGSVRDADGSRAVISMGRRAAGSRARQFRLRAFRTGARWVVSRGRQRVGRARSRRQRVGMDLHRLRPV